MFQLPNKCSRVAMEKGFSLEKNMIYLGQLVSGSELLIIAVLVIALAYSVFFVIISS